MARRGLQRLHERQWYQLSKNCALQCSAIHNLRTTEEGVFPEFSGILSIVTDSPLVSVVHITRFQRAGHFNETGERSPCGNHLSL